MATPTEISPGKYLNQRKEGIFDNNLSTLYTIITPQGIFSDS